MTTHIPFTDYVTLEKKQLMPIIMTKSQIPALWETSATNNRSEVICISNTEGQKKKAIFITFPTQPFTGNNALIPIEIGDYVIKTQYQQLAYTTWIYQIVYINIEEFTVSLQPFMTISDNYEQSLVSYQRAYEYQPYLRSIIRASKHKVRKGKTFDIHYALYTHLIKN